MVAAADEESVAAECARATPAVRICLRVVHEVGARGGVLQNAEMEVSQENTISDMTDTHTRRSTALRFWMPQLQLVHQLVELDIGGSHLNRSTSEWSHWQLSSGSVASQGAWMQSWQECKSQWPNSSGSRNAPE